MSWGYVCLIGPDAGLGREVSPVWYEIPLFYSTSPAAVRGPYDDVSIAPGSRRFGYELEIAAVGGRPGSGSRPGRRGTTRHRYMAMCDWSAGIRRRTR